MERAAIYLRVSTQDQTTANQRLDLERLCAARGWEVVSVYEDHGISGKSDRRPELQRMLLATKRGEHQVILAWSYDRIFRSVKHLLATVDEIEAAGARLVTYREGTDTASPQGRLMVSLLGSIAEFELALIRERVKAGIRRAQAHGKRIGRPRAEVDLERAQELRGRGFSLRAVARELGISKSLLAERIK